MIKYILLVIIIIAALIFCFVAGMQYGLHLYAKRFIEDCYVGDIVIDMSSVESDTITADFEKNPKEFMHCNYVAMGVKTRLP